MAGFKSERVAGFNLECMAGFIGIRSLSSPFHIHALCALFLGVCI